MRELTPTEAQRVDDRPLYVGLHRGAWPLYPGMPACSGNCAQGDGKCPCPTECQIPEPDAINMLDAAMICAAYAVDKLRKWAPQLLVIGAFGLLAAVHFWRAA